MKKFAVVLSGCGVFDGAEIHEAVLSLLAIERNGAEYSIFAPDIPQLKVVNHLTGKDTDETRNVLVESARIARGNIKPLTDFKSADFDIIMFPGGFGAALNLSDFAVKGPDAEVDPFVETAVKAMNAANKPIGAVCIAPATLARILGKGTVTIGTDEGTAEAIEKTGASHKNAETGEIVIDDENKLVTAPCYMLDASISEIANEADKVVKALLAF